MSFKLRSSFERVRFILNFVMMWAPVSTLVGTCSSFEAQPRRATQKGAPPSGSSPIRTGGVSAHAIDRAIARVVHCLGHDPKSVCAAAL